MTVDTRIGLCRHRAVSRFEAREGSTGIIPVAARRQTANIAFSGPNKQTLYIGSGLSLQSEMIARVSRRVRNRGQAGCRILQFIDDERFRMRSI